MSGTPVPPEVGKALDEWKADGYPPIFGKPIDVVALVRLGQSSKRGREVMPMPTPPETICRAIAGCTVSVYRDGAYIIRRHRDVPKERSDHWLCDFTLAELVKIAVEVNEQQK